jgi:hypothetical protein
MEEVDMLHVASFMETVMTSFSDLQNEVSLAAQSFEELNAVDDDIRLAVATQQHCVRRPSPISPQGDDVIQVARENSLEFIQAIRSLSSSTIQPPSGSSNKPVISAPRLNSSNVIQVPRMNSRNTIEVPRLNSRGSIEVPRMNSKNSIDIARTSSKSSISSTSSGNNNPIRSSSLVPNVKPCRTPSPTEIFSLDRIVVETDIQKSLADVPPSALVNFELPPGPVTAAVSMTVLELYKRGGTLSLKSVHKLLKLSYRTLRKLPNITYIKAATGQDRVTVVGDIHGQLYDLLHIVTECGPPSAHVKYLFNGDFVDRGSCGVECMCLLMAMMLGHPG